MIPIRPISKQDLPQSRREREKLVRRQEIIDAARHVFAEKGFAEATLDDVALRAEFGKGTLYNYFENKDALFQSLLQDVFEQLIGIAREAFQSNVPFPERVDAFVRGMLGYYFHNLDDVRLLMRESHQLKSGNPLMELMPQLLSLLSESLAAEQRRRKITTGIEPMRLATILFSMVLGQFNSRVFRNMHACMNTSTAPLSDIFGDMTPADIDAEVEAAVRLIHTVYFNGITRKPSL